MLLLRLGISNIFGNKRSHLYISSRVENQNKNCQNFCMSVWLSLLGSVGNCIAENPGVGTARSLLMFTWARLIGVRNLHTKRCERHERREEICEKTKFSALYTTSPGFKPKLSKCLFLYVFIVTLTFDLFFSSWRIYEPCKFYWFICFPQSSFHIFPLWPWTFIPDLESQ